MCCLLRLAGKVLIRKFSGKLLVVCPQGEMMRSVGPLKLENGTPAGQAVERVGCPGFCCKVSMNH